MFLEFNDVLMRGEKQELFKRCFNRCYAAVLLEQLRHSGEFVFVRALRTPTTPRPASASASTMTPTVRLSFNYST